MNNNDVDKIVGFFSLIDSKKMALIVVGIICIALMVKLIERFATQVFKIFPSRRLLTQQISTILIFIIYIFGFSFLFFGILNPSKELILALGGSIAVAVGFALKDLAASVIAGVILLFDQPFQVGDRVTFDGVYGEIKSIGLRAVRLVTLDDNLITIPNSRFFNDVVASGNSGSLDMMVVTDFHIALDGNLTLARDIIHETLLTSRFVYLKKPVSVLISEVAVAEKLALQLRAKAYVLDVKYEKAFQTDIVLRVTAAFNQHRIERPEQIITQQNPQLPAN